MAVLAVAALLAVVIGWRMSLANDDDDTVVIDTRVTFETPSIETNAQVEGDPLPDSTVQDLQGNEINIASLVGQPMVINLWGSTCGPCKQELPDFAAVHLVYGDDVRFVGISYLAASDREEAFARDRGVQYELYYDADYEFMNDVGVVAFPVTLFVDANGRIVEQTGQLDEAELTDLIENTLL